MYKCNRMRVQQKLIFTSFIVMLLATVGCSSKKNVTQTVESDLQINSQLSDDVVRGSLIISYDGEDALARLKKAIETYGAEIVYEYKIINSVAIRVPDTKTDEQAIQYFQKVKGVLSVERDRIMHTQD